MVTLTLINVLVDLPAGASASRRRWATESVFGRFGAIPHANSRAFHVEFQRVSTSYGMRVAERLWSRHIFLHWLFLRGVRDIHGARSHNLTVQSLFQVVFKYLQFSTWLIESSADARLPDFQVPRSFLTIRLRICARHRIKLARP